MYSRYFNATKSLINIVDCTQSGNRIEEKRSSLYLEWISKQSKLFDIEKSPLVIPDKIFPKEITSFAFGKNNSTIQVKINKYYTKSTDGKKYFRNTTTIDANDAEDLLHHLVFLRGNVVWIEFGFNIGCEFGGKHPAIILKDLGDALIVAPLTSGTLENPKSAEVVIDVVFNLPPRDRYTNITRITPISIYRVDMDSPIGSIRSRKMKEIFNAMKKDWNF